MAAPKFSSFDDRVPALSSADLVARKLRRRLLGAAAAVAAAAAVSRIAVAAAGQAASGGARPIEIGLLPYLPTGSLLSAHQGLRSYFQEIFRRPVVLSTAPDFKTFQRRVLNGDFDFVVIGAGPGWQAHLDARYEVVAAARRSLRILVAVAADGPIRRVAELRGGTVAVIDPLTMTSQTTMAILRDQKLEPGRDVVVRHEKTPFNCAQGVVLGEFTAAGIPSVIMPALPVELRQKLRIIHESDEMPGVLFMVRPAADLPTPQEFQAALLRFAETGAGRTFVRELDHDGLVKPDPDRLRVLERFVPETRRVMAEP